MLKNTPDAYGDVAKVFHWFIAFGLLSMIFFGWYIGDLEGPQRGALMGLHKSIGVTILIVVACRFLWRIYTGHPVPLDAHAKWERLLATTVHYLLYIAAFCMPLSGWLMSNAAGRSVELFGLPMPTLIAPDQGLRDILGSAHSLLAWSILSLAALHVIGTLKHVFIDKDGTLKRMLP